MSLKDYPMMLAVPKSPVPNLAGLRVSIRETAPESQDRHRSKLLVNHQLTCGLDKGGWQELRGNPRIRYPYRLTLKPSGTTCLSNFDHARSKVKAKPTRAGQERPLGNSDTPGANARVSKPRWQPKAATRRSKERHRRTVVPSGRGELSHGVHPRRGSFFACVWPDEGRQAA